MKKTEIHFKKISERLFSYLCSLYQPDERFPYPLQGGQQGNLFGTLFACYTAYLIGKIKDLPGKDKIAEIVLNLRHPETGLFTDPNLTPDHYMVKEVHSDFYVHLQTTSFCYACLHALGIEVDHRVKWLEPLLDEGKIESWLSGLDWKNPWLVSNLDMFIGIFLLEWQKYDPADQQVSDTVNAYFRWHDKHQNPETGFWGDQSDLLNAMAGAYHIFIHYDRAGQEIPFKREVIDSTLSLISRDGLFVYGGGGGSCEDMDAIDILIRCSLHSPHRENEIRRAMLQAAAMLSTGQSKDGGFSWRIQPTVHNLFKLQFGRGYLYGKIYDFLYKLVHRSHYNSHFFYSSLSCYPFKINQSDMWSSWFRPLSLAFIAKRYPDDFTEPCNWNLPPWPGLGFNPFQKKHIE